MGDHGSVHHGGAMGLVERLGDDGLAVLKWGSVSGMGAATKGAACAITGAT